MGLSFLIGSSNLNVQSGHTTESSSRLHRAASSPLSFDDFFGRFVLGSSLLLFMEPLGLPSSLSPTPTSFSGASKLSNKADKAGWRLKIYKKVSLGRFCNFCWRWARCEWSIFRSGFNSNAEGLSKKSTMLRDIYGAYMIKNHTACFYFVQKAHGQPET